MVTLPCGQRLTTGRREEQKNGEEAHLTYHRGLKVERAESESLFGVVEEENVMRFYMSDLGGDATVSADAVK